MADRTVSYVFRGSFTSLNAGLATAGRNVGELGTKLTALDRNGSKMRAGLTQLGGTAGKIGLVAAAGLGAAVFAAANFDKAMSAVQAATHESADNMELLRKAAIKAGADTVYSASEAAGAIEELAKAGVSTKDILGGGLSGALNLAAAGAISVTDAAEAAAGAMTQFKLSGDQVNHVADLLAAGAGKAQGGVSDLNMALKQSGLVASQAGLSIDDTVGVLSAFASNSLLGSDAGTSLKQMLLSLENPSTKAAGIMQEYGIAVYDASGHMNSMTNIAGQLQAAFKGKTDAERDSALATIFGSDAVRAANVLYTEGASGITDWTNKVNDQGYAAETAATRMNNLSGDLEQFKGSLETALIGAGEGSQGPLRKLVQGATEAVNAFNRLPQAGQSAATGLLAVTAVIGGGLWFTSKTITGIANTKQALDGLGISASKAGGRLARIGASSGTILVAAQAIGALVNATTDLGNSVNAADVSRDLEAIGSGATTDSLKKLSSALEGVNEAGGGTVNALFAIPSALTGIKTSFATNKDTVEQFDQQLASLVESGNLEQAAADFKAIREAAAAHGGVSDSDVVKSFDAYKTALANAAAEAKTTSAATDVAAGATKGFGTVARQAAEASKAEADALRNATKAMQDKTSATLAGFDAETGYRQALKDAAAQAKKNDAGIRGNTDAALNNRSALSGLASAWNNQSEAVKNNVNRYQDARKSFIDTATAMGVPTAAAKKLANQILEIPKSRVAKVGVDGADPAIAKVQTLNRELSKVVSKTITLTVNRVGSALNGLKFDSGGYTGDGGVHEPAGIVHKGEVVIPQRYVQRDWSMLKGRYGDLPGFAGGGLVGSTYARTSNEQSHLFAFMLTVDQLTDNLGALNKVGLKELKARDNFVERQIKLGEKVLSAEKDRLDEMRADLKAMKDARADFAQSVGSNFKTSLFGDTDLAAAGQNGLLGSGFGNQVYLFAQQQMAAEEAKARADAAKSGEAYTPGDPQAFNMADWVQQYLDTLSQQQLAALQVKANSSQLKQDTVGANSFADVLAQLRKEGLSGGAYKELALSGNLAQAQAYASMDPSVIKQLVQDYKDRNRATQRLGQGAVPAAMNQAIRQQAKAAERQADLTQEIRDNQRELVRMNKLIDKRLEQLNKIEARQAKDTGDAVAAAVNGAVTHGQKKGG